MQRYVPGVVPLHPDDLLGFLRTELAAIAAAYAALADGQLDLITVAPAKPRNGMLRYAAAGVLGVNAGFYGYHSGVWNFLG